ncbi:MAG: V-type ATPase subunit [Treponema sp.]|jgi:vacuolar-type H+-ATPase subunit C/Vma6|nr:V-type ATPase subunit [Treponema sp.]
MWTDSGYAYAKASWIIGKSFLGKRISSLSGLHTLSDFDRLIFPDSYRELPGRELLPSLEKRIIERCVNQILGVVKSYSQPPKLLIRMLKGFEYGDLKECFAHIAGGNEEMPVISDIGRFKTVRFDAYPDVAAMIKKTEYESLLSGDIKSIKKGADLISIDAKIDYRFYQSLIESLSQLDYDDRETASRIIADEISLRNCFWALRLRAYYQKSELQTAKYLMDFKLLGNIHQKRDSLCAEAKSSLDFSLDIRENWQGWRWERFLNQEDSLNPSGTHWAADPRYFQNAASEYLYHIAFHGFHSSPMSVGAIFCFIKLKMFEEDLLTSVAEGLALGMDTGTIFKMLPSFKREAS